MIPLRLLLASLLWAVMSAMAVPPGTAAPPRSDELAGSPPRRIPRVRDTEGYGLNLPEPVLPEHIKFYALVLGLDEGQLALTREFHSLYLDEWIAVLDQRLAGMVTASRQATGSSGNSPQQRVEAYASMLDQRRVVLDAMTEIDNRFMADFALLLNEQQLEQRWPIVLADRSRRMTGLFRGSLPLSSTDLVDHLLSVYPEVNDIPATTWVVVEQYILESLPAFTRRADGRVELHREGHALFCRVVEMNPREEDGWVDRADPAEREANRERSFAVAAAMHEADKRVQQVNKRFLPRFSEALPQPERSLFERSVRDAAYGMIHPDEMDPNPVFDELPLRVELSETEVAQVEAIRTSIVATYDSICRSMERRYEEWSDYSQLNPSRDGAPGNAYHKEMRELHERRKAASVAAITALKELLTEERLQAALAFVKYEEFRITLGDREWRAPG